MSPEIVGSLAAVILDPIYIIAAIICSHLSVGRVKVTIVSHLIVATMLTYLSALLDAEWHQKAGLSGDRVILSLTAYFMLASITVFAFNFSSIRLWIRSRLTYKHNKESTDRSLIDLVKVTLVPLMAQKGVLVDSYGLLDDSAKSNWSLGYMGGFSDYVLQSKDIPMSGESYAFITIVFITIYGEEEGPLHFRKFMDLQESNDKMLFRGMLVGGKESREYFCSEELEPTGWVDHSRH